MVPLLISSTLSPTVPWLCYCFLKHRLLCIGTCTPSWLLLQEYTGLRLSKSCVGSLSAFWLLQPHRFSSLQTVPAPQARFSMNTDRWDCNPSGVLAKSTTSSAYVNVFGFSLPTSTPIPGSRVPRAKFITSLNRSASPRMKPFSRRRQGNINLVKSQGLYDSFILWQFYRQL